MCNIILFNLNQLLENIHNKYKIPKIKLKPILNTIKIPLHVTYNGNFKVYSDSEDGYFILLSNVYNNYYYALKFD
jgi:hypothetical protein